VVAREIVGPIFLDETNGKHYNKLIPTPLLGEFVVDKKM
jgi:hypothetical protein